MINDAIVFDTTVVVHRHEKLGFRGGKMHKSMTECVSIWHRKGEKHPKGRVPPNIAQVEDVLGPALAGSWAYDFILGCRPPEKNWRLRHQADGQTQTQTYRKGDAVRKNAEKSCHFIAPFVLM